MKEDTVAVPKRKQSRANTRARRSQWKAETPTLVKTIENGKVVAYRTRLALSFKYDSE